MKYDLLYPYWLLSEALHKRIDRYQTKKEYMQRFARARRKNPQTVFLIFTPGHSNLGDHAIACAETELLRSQGIDYIEITGYELEILGQKNLLGMMNGKPILINGGGNLGTLWYDVECLHRQIVRQNPRSPIVIFPNTVYYEDSPWGQKSFQESIEIYNQHKKLHFYAREKVSYSTMKDAYKNVKLIPDMVFLLDRNQKNERRTGCLLCLRGDVEKTLTEEQKQEVQSVLQDLFGDNIRKTDTLAPEDVLPADREEELKKKFAEFGSAELVVTDRLHGMVFCAITGTPCLVLNSKSPKVFGCYEWIQELPYIQFVENVSQIRQAYRQIPEGPHYYDNRHLWPYYEKLSVDLKTILFGR